MALRESLHVNESEEGSSLTRLPASLGTMALRADKKNVQM